MMQALTSAADLDPVAIAKVVAVVLAISLVLAVLEAVVRHALWSLFNFAATFFAFLCKALLTFANFLSAQYAQAIGGLSEEGQYGDGQPKPWVGWFLVGPIVYCVLMFVFMASDLTVAILIFEAMGLTLGTAARSTIPIPLENAMGVVFVALAVFWGIVLFDLWRLTPFSYIWSGLRETQRRTLIIVVLICLSVTILTGLTMGVWSQAQLKGGLPEPWQTVLPWLIRGALVSLLICATAVAGKPFGSAITAMWVVALLIVRAGTFVALVLLRFVVMLVRQLLHVPLALLALAGFIGGKLWNWLAGFGWARRMRLGRLATAAINVGELGGDAETPLTFHNGVDPLADHTTAVLNSNKARMRRLYEEVLPVADGNLEEFFAPSVIHRDIQDGTLSGIGPLSALLTDMRDAFSGLEIKVHEQVAEAETVMSRITLAGTVHGAHGTGKPVRLSGVDSVRLQDGKIVERWGLFDIWAPGVNSRLEEEVGVPVRA